MEWPGIPQPGMPGFLFCSEDFFRAGAALPIYTDRWIPVFLLRKKFTQRALKEYGSNHLETRIMDKPTFDTPPRGMARIMESRKDHGTPKKRKNYFELEIPGRLNWRFEDAEKAVHWGAKLMVASIHLAYLYAIGEKETRIGVVLRLMKIDETCPQCDRNEGLIRLTGILESFDEYTICRHCGRRFRTGKN
jgi:hypothetical protein